ncbi:MinD/ParA family ATP-binding protein [Actinoplanes sichuanensis]|uniref:Chromosome partitioning protein n=1 Tax=Actinoplanes sichuanensis TaxID=512349 RepID=A0ABW4A4A0_9ACTN|nr:chromosome partitioning protein [Actinoplanes sichuanensis]
MADENADRVYVPGAEGSTPARDVEPFWADEPETPVHGRAVPLTDRVPPVGMVQVEPGVFRPADGPPLPPGVHVPGQRSTDSPAHPQPFPQPGPPPVPHSGPPPVPHSGPPPVPDPGPQPVPQSGPPGGSQSGPPAAPFGQPEGHSTADSPWAQPLHRPTPAAPQPVASEPDRPHQAIPQQDVFTSPVDQRPGVPQAVDQQGAFPSPTSRQGTHPQPTDQQGPFPQPTGQQSAFPQPVDQRPTFPSPGDQRLGDQQPVTRPVSAQPSVDLRSSGNATAVPPQAQPHPQPPDAAPATPPNAHAAPTDRPQGATDGWPNAHAAPTDRPQGAAESWPNAHAAPHDGGQAWPQAHTPDAQQTGTEQASGGEVDPFQELNWMVDGTPTAEEFARRRLARPSQQSATMGARAVLQKGMFGLVKLAPGQRELEYKQDVEMVRRNFGGLRQVTVVNPKGGAGKTVAVLLLAMTFGQKRGGYVLAWDNNETQGTLGMRAQQDFHARTVRDMMRDLHLFQGAQGRVGDLSQYVRAQGEGMFDVLASDESATAGEMLTAASFAEIRDVVSRFYKLIFVDTGNNVRAENWQAAMDATDQLVITMSARNDSAETAARALDHLEQSGRRRLVRQAVTIVTMPPTRKDIDLQWIQQHFAARTRAVLVAPYERLIDSGEPIRYGELSGNTKDAWLKIAAAVADGL